MKNDLWQYLAETDKPIVLYGMGNGADRTLDKLLSLGKKPAGVFASDEFVRGQSFRGYTVRTFDDMAAQYDNMLILVCFGSGREEVLRKIERYSEKYELYCPDVPLYGDTFFDSSFVTQNREKLALAAGLLFDDISRTTFENIIRFKLSGNPAYLHACECRGDSMALPFGNHETFLDIGAYNGDTVAAFLKHVEHYHKIYAVEPDAANFRRLVKNVADIPKVECMQAVISDHTGTCRFASGLGRGSACADKGADTPSLQIDDFINQNVSFIKMDAEGMEGAALRGARQTIAKLRPKMMIAGYHRPEDLFSIVLFVHELRADYKIFCRHFRHNLAWDTYFYFI